MLMIDTQQHARDGGVVIIGAGPAGISAALSLNDLGIRPLVVERAGEVAAAWRGRYDRLKLNTGRQFSHLPGRRYPKGTPVYPSRDQVVEHFEKHAREEGVELKVNTEVKRIDRQPSGWLMSTSDGDIEARHVVVATGYLHTPVLPNWPGSFAGELSHSHGYRNPAPYAGKRVLVVGSGSSGMEIAHDLSTGAAAKVWLSVRTPPNIMPRNGPAGLPNDVLSIPFYHLPARLSDRIATVARLKAFGDLTEFGLPVPAEGPFARAHRLDVAPTIVDPEVVDAVRDGSVEVVPAVAGFEDSDVVLGDGSRINPDAVIAATGYRAGLEPLVGHLGVLAPDGVPIYLSPSPAADGLYFHGMLTRPGLIGHVAKQSRALAKSIARG
ncbi:flavin-containing monooxygenase [Mycobacterium montefiorense]|uniref:Monooxygenase n=2 Tax=Mycobacterium montefiorense TaxID=154654 RepID=A0AA37PQL8_9MYCO|nr:NAD(P)/FAD-dependent oxidoreductase [Mycobacterium montefiorense]GKU36878.1 monooxygenase [Mycobacterium montefiorense]GKU43216.1 monooxygenase [Mycobacterium montefiorense]GKU48473.1 monooxygenase [Mycobacterium montefiorense]GKU50503.1 monooxygenase [Mycobacterium montefiorense]GKU74681.1 monooxygenase [Mycobacterium montefiorense]